MATSKKWKFLCCELDQLGNDKKTSELKNKYKLELVFLLTSS